MAESNHSVESEGAYRVGLDFNPSADPRVSYIKISAADLINYIAINGKDPRCTALAQTAFEDAAMWAVKSVTKKPRNEPGATKEHKP